MSLNESTAWDEAMLLERKRQARLEAADKAMEALKKSGQLRVSRWSQQVCSRCHETPCDTSCEVKAWEELR